MRFEKANSFERDEKPYIHLENFPHVARYYHQHGCPACEGAHTPSVSKPEEARTYAMKIIRMMEFHWGMKRPSVLISITGGASNFKLSTEL